MLQVKQVQDRIIADLKFALIECNNADCPMDEADGYFANDLPAGMSRQSSAYGDISNALRKIAGDDVVEYWINNGEFE